MRFRELPLPNLVQHAAQRRVQLLPGAERGALDACVEPGLAGVVATIRIYASFLASVPVLVTVFMRRF